MLHTGPDRHPEPVFIGRTGAPDRLLQKLADAGPHRLFVSVAGTADHPRVDLDAFLFIR
ncbi:MAG: hypothetical protein H0V20_06935 [Actinobacteria bacterium]|nr:hypothetical protein [Actinomycetota bacterium]